jgi:hypothetical protein
MASFAFEDLRRVSGGGGGACDFERSATRNRGRAFLPVKSMVRRNAVAGKKVEQPLR